MAGGWLAGGGMHDGRRMAGWRMHALDEKKNMFANQPIVLCGKSTSCRSGYPSALEEFIHRAQLFNKNILKIL